MTAKELREIAKLMKEFGISHFKSGDAELVMHSFTPVAEPKAPKRRGKKTAPKGDEEPIPHVVTELTSLMKMDDNDLVDLLFPEPKEEPLQ